MNSKSVVRGPCEYCDVESDLYIKKEDGKLETDMFMCDQCKRLLKSPETALQLIRGHISIHSRGNNDYDKEKIEKFMEMISSWTRQN